MKTTVHTLTIAGFDPSGGAGVLADIKTFEKNKCQGMAVQTANTIQTEDQFFTVDWIDEPTIISQLKALLDRYTFNAVKIGLIPSFNLLHAIIPLIRQNNETASIVWDPVLSVSAGFDFKHHLDGLKEVCSLVDWITPNWEEAQRLSGNDDVVKGSIHLSYTTKVYLKGGHNDRAKGKDFLIEKGVKKGFNPKKGRFSEKHGSGCVFSAALTANLAKGYPLQKAVLRSKRYVEYFLQSNASKLGTHYGK